MADDDQTKTVHWLGDSLEVLRSFPKRVRQEVGFALYFAEGGQARKRQADEERGKRRVRDRVRLRQEYVSRGLRGEVPTGLYVLHVFQKKAKRGISTPKAEVALIKQAKEKEAMERG